MIKTIIFDIGNVLAGFSWKEYFMKFGYSKEILARIAQATVEHSVWNEFDRGAMSDEELLEAFVKNDPGIEKELRESLANVNGMLVRYEYAIPWIKELKEKGYRVLVLSNFANCVYRDCRDAIDFLEYTDGGILSFQEKLVKPQPEVYSLLLKRYGLAAEECVFLDDTERNLTAAAEFGIRTIHFKNREQAVEELKTLGVK